VLDLLGSKDRVRYQTKHEISIQEIKRLYDDLELTLYIFVRILLYRLFLFFNQIKLKGL
jgi:hypothetical protein